MTNAIINGKVILSDKILESGYVIFRDSEIIEAGSGAPTMPVDTVYDANGNYVSAGFIDIHTHGAGNSDFMDGTCEAFVQASMTHMRHGTTSLSPTALTCAPEELERAFVCYHQAVKALDGVGPNLLGMHLEGPFFSKEQAGAQDPKYLQVPNAENVKQILSHAEDISRLSAAVEIDGVLELGETLAKKGILASIGHSNASYEQAVSSFDHGFTHVTHLYSGMSMLHREGPYRHLGVVEAAYMTDGMTVEIIADGKHLPPELLKYILKFKPIDKICLITDSMRGAGMKEGEIVKLGSLENGQDVIIEDSVAMLMDHTAFAGSVCTTDRCVRTMYKLADASLVDAVKMMTENPARILHLTRKGRLAPDTDADICIFDDDINIQSVFVMGKKMI